MEPISISPGQQLLPTHLQQEGNWDKQGTAWHPHSCASQAQPRACSQGGKGSAQVPGEERGRLSSWGSTQPHQPAHRALPSLTV